MTPRLDRKIMQLQKDIYKLIGKALDSPTHEERSQLVEQIQQLERQYEEQTGQIYSEANSFHYVSGRWLK